ncbi:putrescine hydroxycinnamoyltransferase 2-like [Carex rostrata]
MVVPSEKTPQHDLWLSNLDIMLAQNGYTPVIYFYPASSSSDPKFVSVDAVKIALAKMLVPYYPFAGRLVMGADDRLKIDCNAVGALFVVANSEFTLDNFNELEPSPEMSKMFLPSMIGSAHQYPTVLLMLQV